MENTLTDSNKFYSSITENFDFIFPLGKVKKRFLIEELDEKRKLTSNKILTLGCSTGKTDLFLADQIDNANVLGIDIDDEMIRYAKNKLKESDLNSKQNLNFQVMDITKIADHFEQDSFNSMICLGNTFVHILDSIDRAKFIKSIFDILKDKGKFILQIINYDNILSNKIEKLPLIDNEKVSFYRKYNLEFEDKNIKFITELVVKQSQNKSIKNSIDLYPITFSEVEDLFLNSGFLKEKLKFYGDYKKTKYSKDQSYNLIVIAEK